MSGTAIFHLFKQKARNFGPAPDRKSWADNFRDCISYIRKFPQFESEFWAARFKYCDNLDVDASNFSSILLMKFLQMSCCVVVVIQV